MDSEHNIGGRQTWSMIKIFCVHLLLTWGSEVACKLYLCMCLVYKNFVVPKSNIWLY